MMRPKTKRELSMVNATWDQPATLKCARVDKMENSLSSKLFHRSTKHCGASSKQKRKHSPCRNVNKLKTDKEIDQLLSLLRDPSFCGSSHRDPSLCGSSLRDQSLCGSGCSRANQVQQIPAAILCDFVLCPQRRQATDKQTSAHEIITSIPTSRCTNLNLSLSVDAIRSLDREFGWKRSESREADRGNILQRTASSSL